MQSKQRVINAMRRQAVDKVPYGEFAVDFDTVEKILGRETFYRAKAKTQIALWQGRREEIAQSLKSDIIELYEKLDCMDIINLAASAGGQLPPKDYDPNPPKQLDDRTWEDDQGRVYKYSDKTADITIVHDPAQWEREFTPEQYMVDPAFYSGDYSEFEVVDHVIAHFQDSRFLISPSGEDIGLLLLGGFERGLIEYIENPEVVQAASEYRLKEENLNDDIRIRKGCDAVMLQNDYSFNRGCLISPALFRQIGLPIMSKRIEHIKETHGLFCIKHACGNNTQLLNDFANMGIDCYQAVQATAGMDIVEVHKQYCDSFSVWGGVSVESLVSGTADDVAGQVRHVMQSLRDKPGFILGSSHSIAVGTKYENFMRMLDELERWR